MPLLCRIMARAVRCHLAAAQGHRFRGLAVAGTSTEPLVTTDL
eukprot:COSAG02_NODE_31908_length_525_cov_1.011737_1_plen_42_part_10